MGGEGDGTLRSGTEKRVKCWKHRFASFKAVLDYSDVQQCVARERKQAYAFQIWKLELEEVIEYFTPR